MRIKALLGSVVVVVVVTAGVQALKGVFKCLHTIVF